jgi:hypothetical protein
MGQSYRIRTELGITKTINVELTQEFEFLEILSLKLQQQDVYSRLCADYGVVVGRVTANNGLGIPYARVAVFIPIEQFDQSNPIISSIYPYNSPSDRNEDGYRYNLLPYEPSYTGHAATGTLPSRLDVLTGQTAVEIFDKYYKLTAKTNDSGDYMIMGVPLGEQTIVMDVDLSDIGEFSLTPQDLIRMGLATEAQVAGNRFRTSADLNSLPQIINLTKVVEVSPLWGEPAVCQIAINRVDFDLRNEANVDIQPTAVFMGSIFSTSEQYAIKRNSRPKDDFGNLCQLEAGPGQIIAIRQTLQVDLSGNPFLERYDIEKNGNVIDDNGAWLIELPMNLEYLVTNEFGERIISYDPTIGIPTKSKYRFKIKWQQSSNASEQYRRAYYLIPNVREFGWPNNIQDPNLSGIANPQLNSSYYFGLDWSGYTNGLQGQQAVDKLDQIINCEDTFYEFEYNRVYTVSALIDQYKDGARGKFIGVKEIDNNSCEETVNKFPVNEGFRNFDFLFFIYSILLQVLQIISIPLLIAYHLIAALWNFMVDFKNTVLTVLYTLGGALIAIGLIELLFAGTQFFTGGSFIVIQKATKFIILGGKILGSAILLNILLNNLKRRSFNRFYLPILTYPDCQTCSCGESFSDSDIGGDKSSLLTQFSASYYYYEKILQSLASIYSNEDQQIVAQSFSQAMGTVGGDEASDRYKTTFPEEVTLIDGNDKFFSYSPDLPFGERINVFNTRKKFFDGLNKISVSFDFPSNSALQHFDNTITVVSQTTFDSGSLLTFIDIALTQDVNFTTTGSTVAFGFPNGISGTSINPGVSQYPVEYAISQTTNSSPVNYILSTGSTITNYKFPADLEYYQVITAITVSDAVQIWGPNTTNGLLPTIFSSDTDIIWNRRTGGSWGSTSVSTYPVSTTFVDFDKQFILILQRGVDPYSPNYTNKYGIGKLLGYPNENDFVITASTRLNIPIQKNTDTTTSVQKHNNQNNIFYSSHFFKPGNDFSAFTTSTVGYYGQLDAQNPGPRMLLQNINGQYQGICSTWFNDFFTTSNTERVKVKKYEQYEDLSGAAYYYLQGGNKPSEVITSYYTKVLLPSLITNPLNISNGNINVMRTDRLPSSDGLDGSSFNNNPALLQQNLNFSTYIINTTDQGISTVSFSSGADIVPPDIEGQLAWTNVLDSFNCENAVSLRCYEKYNTSFGVNRNCATKDDVENGCYVFMRKPLKDLGKDIRNFNEWGYRYRFFFGLCRGVLAQSFTNNWVNGSLFTFPIQITKRWGRDNKVKELRYPRKLIYFDTSTNNFYYRSSPWLGSPTTGSFIGRSTLGEAFPMNKRNLLFPTTIINLGMKDSFYDEITFTPSTAAYVMNNLNPTSYQDTSNIVNLFVISRIANSTFLTRITNNDSLNVLFSRNQGIPQKNRIDADLAQMMSINSEIGVVPFTPEFYDSTGPVNTNPVVIYGTTADNALMGIFFSSTTFDLQTKDFVSPGIINFRPNPFVPPITYPYGIKSQKVPFYQWQLNQPSNIFTIFGSETNNWATDSLDIITSAYQNLNRRNLTTPNYFVPSNTSLDIYQRGYIFNVDSSGNYDPNVWNSMKSKFMIGAPNHFYFGLFKGKSAMDLFKTKYLPNE